MSKFYPRFIYFFVFVTQWVVAQNSNEIKIHSHNDYQQDIPFWTAYNNGLNSIEIDVFLKNNTLYVTHSESEIIKERTLENLYLDPLKKVISHSWSPNKKLQLLIDIKSEAQITLDKLVSILNQYPKLIDQNNVSIVISGNRPDPKEYYNYPEYILFDYQSLDPLKNEEIWNKIALLSLSFKTFSNWNGKVNMNEKDYQKVDSVVRIAHQYGKPFRFWATPDTQAAWELFRKLGIDYINTDQPAQASTYFNKVPQ